MPTMYNIAIYENCNGTITLQQESDGECYESITLHPDQVGTIIKWLNEVADEIQNKEATQ